MKIDYMLNPLAVVKRFHIPYGDGLHLEWRTIAHVEEGFDHVTWLDGEVRYTGRCEIDRVSRDLFYQALRRGAPMQAEADKKMREWCKSLDLTITKEISKTVGVTL